MECETFRYSRASDPLLYACIDACHAAYFTDAKNHSITTTSGEWTVFAISGTWFSTPERIRDYVRLDLAVAAEAVNNIRTHPFYKAVRQAVLDTIRETPEIRLALTGHSAGGCVAALVAAEVQTLCPCACIVLNPYLNTSIVESLLAGVSEPLGVLMFFTVEDITIPLIRAAIPMMERRGWLRWVIPNFKDSEYPPIHIIEGNFKGRDPIEAFSSVQGCLLARVAKVVGTEKVESQGVRAARAGIFFAVVVAVAAIAYQQNIFPRV